MKKVTKNNEITIDDLAIMVAKGFEDVKSELKSEISGVKNELKKEISEVKENVRITRNDVLNIGDKFVSYHTFDQLANRVSNLEKKQK
jgi:hypothetical protein